MYEKFYNFSGIPFLLTPDSRFFFGSSGHSRAIAHLVYGLAQEEGFIVITGEVGAGKTTLVEQLWTQLDRQTYFIARIVTTQVSRRRPAAPGDGRISASATRPAWTRRRCCGGSSSWCASSARRDGAACWWWMRCRTCSLAALEELRMLSNITVDGHASLQTILLGQPQFRPDPGQPRCGAIASARAGVVPPRSADRGRDAQLHRPPAENGRLERRSALGRRRLRRGVPPHRRHPAADQHAVLPRSAVTARWRRRTPSPAAWSRRRRAS